MIVSERHTFKCFVQTTETLMGDSHRRPQQIDIGIYVD